LYAYSFFDELILLYPLYAVLFAESGLSTVQISSLFVIWSAASVAVEIPSGVVADLVSRRLLLTIAPLLAAAGYGLWVVVPSYPAFALGFVLWGASGALQSGAFEALAYEELDRHGAAAQYARVIGRATAASTVATAIAIGTAGPVFGLGGYPALGAASVLAGLVCAAIGATFPEHRLRTHRHPDSGVRDFAAVLRAGVQDVRSTPRVRAAVVLLIAISAIWGALDEYVGLLALDTGVATEDIPALILAVYVGVAVGGLLGGVGSRLPSAAVGALLGIAAVALAVGALSGHPVGFALIGFAFCVFQLAEILADARLQHAITGPARSTVTSVAGFGTEVATIGVYVVYGAASGVAGHGAIFAAWAAAYGLLAVAIAVRSRR
jgi:MFS family permease